MTLPQILESLLFASPKPLGIVEIRAALRSAAEFTEEPAAAALARSREQEIVDALASLSARYRHGGHGLELTEGANGWRLTTISACAPWVRQLFPEARPTKLSAPALETLSIIAYRQPVTRADVEGVRGVDAGGVVQTLLDRGLVRIAGRSDLPGRPLIYATTQFFLDHFGLKSLTELPAFDELRRTMQAAEKAKEAAEHAHPPAAPSPRQETARQES
jgi:segregation and condensation protein B